MKLWLIRDCDRWGYSLNIVRAESEEGALKLVMGVKDDGTLRTFNRDRVEVVPLPADGEPTIVWCYDHSPDTPRDH